MTTRSWHARLFKTQCVYDKYILWRNRFNTVHSSLSAGAHLDYINPLMWLTNLNKSTNSFYHTQKWPFMRTTYYSGSHFPPTRLTDESPEVWLFLKYCFILPYKFHYETPTAKTFDIIWKLSWHFIQNIGQKSSCRGWKRKLAFVISYLHCEIFQIFIFFGSKYLEFQWNVSTMNVNVLE